MFTRTGRFLISLLALLFCATVVQAQQDSQRAPAFTQQEIDQILAPVALYPDALLSQILMAATYPRDVTEAAQWSRRNSDLNGDRAVRAVERYDWDPSVKSLVAFPQILDMMNEKYNWTQDLGDAFLDQQAQVMDTVQYLRRRADVAGNLRSSDQLRVVVRDSSYVVEFANPQVVYLPYYNPVVVYGTWWWPTHQPVYWQPWPGYYTRTGYRGYAWGPPIAVSRGFFYGAPDWQQRRINIVNTNNYYYRSQFTEREMPRAIVAGAPPVWQHDAARRRDVPRRTAVSAQPDPRVDAVPEWRATHERETGAIRNRSAIASPPAPASSPSVQPQIRGAPTQSLGTVPAPAVPAPTVTRAEPTRGTGTEWNRNEARDGRGERGQRRDGRMEPANRPLDRAVVQPAPAAPAVAPAVVTQPPAGAAVKQLPVPPPVRVAPAPVLATPSAPRGAPAREAAVRDRERPAFEDRGERGHRPEGREQGNRPAQRENAQPVAAPAPVARPAPEPVPAPAIAREPAPRRAPAATEPRPVPASASHAPDGGGRRGEQRRA